jgi:lysophospholipase L1-like esterase
MTRHLYLALLLPVLACERGASQATTADDLRSGPSALDDTSQAISAGLSADQTLSSLGRHQARALCTEAGRLTDLCAVSGRRLGNAAGCAAAVATCRAEQPGPRTDCSDARFDFPEPCSATVQDYLSCVEAWSKQSSCTFDTLGLDAAPEQCLPLLRACPYLKSEFGPAAAIVPRCDAANSPVRVDDNNDLVGLDCGRPLPARMVTLGDSIAACFSSFFGYRLCAPALISDYLRERYAPGLAYQTVAVPGAITTDVLTQALAVLPGPGHLLVWVYVGGNDLARCSSQPTQAALQTCIEDLLSALPGMWSQIFAYFNDRGRFPDGVTFMLNTQYGPWDQCTRPRSPALGAAVDEPYLQRFNRDVIMQAALERSDTLAVDQYPDFLGHGGNADRRGCPHCYRDDNSFWLFDGTHPNDRGSQHIADKWKLAIDRMYGSCP